MTTYFYGNSYGRWATSGNTLRLGWLPVSGDTIQASVAIEFEEPVDFNEQIFGGYEDVASVCGTCLDLAMENAMLRMMSGKVKDRQLKIDLLQQAQAIIPSDDRARGSYHTALNKAKNDAHTKNHGQNTRIRVVV